MLKEGKDFIDQVLKLFRLQWEVISSCRSFAQSTNYIIIIIMITITSTITTFGRSSLHLLTSPFKLLELSMLTGSFLKAHWWQGLAKKSHLNWVLLWAVGGRGGKVKSVKSRDPDSTILPCVHFSQNNWILCLIGRATLDCACHCFNSKDPPAFVLPIGHYCATQCTMGKLVTFACKSNHKVVNFGKLFLGFILQILLRRDRMHNNGS